jgi:Tol biopolymer transport system component/DNA-binding winged helix-turn-helix (wHTH) protein
MTAEQTDYQFDTVVLRPRAFQVLRDGKPLPLEPKSIRVLVYLVEHRDRAVGKDELLSAVWQDTAVTDNALTRVVAQLRRELGDDARQPRYIQTIPTFGYRFLAEVRPSEKVSPPAVAGPRWQLVLPAVLIIAAAAGWLAMRSTPSAGPVARTARTTQVTTSAGLDVAPSFSPDGSLLAYSSDRSGSFEIYTRPSDSNQGEIQITSDGGQNIQAAWSPDGRFIAYHSVLKRGIWIIPAVGGVPRQLTTSGSRPAWSPDGLRIAYSSADVSSLSVNDLISAAQTVIRLVPVSGGQPVDVVSGSTTSVRQFFPSWSPDGERILFSAVNGRAGELWTVRPNGSDARLVARADLNFFVSPVFSPGGDSIYYSALSKARDFGIRLQRLEDGKAAGEPIEISRTGTTIPLYLAVSADGRRLAYTAAASTSHLWSVATAGHRAKASPQPVYRDAVFRSSFPAFSPDGKRIAFFARLFGGSGDVWVMNADGSGATALTSNRSPDVLPSWTADGSAVVYSRQVDEGNELWQISPLDRSEKPLMQGLRTLGWPRLSPDGTTVVNHTLVYHSPGSESLNIRSQSVSGGQPRQLTHDREGAGFPSWSPDGKWIAYELLRGSNSYLAVMDRNGDQQTQLNSDAGHSWVFNWSPDGSKILFAGFRDGAWNLWWLDRATRQQQRLTSYTTLETYVRYPAWSPAGDRIVYELGSTRGNIYRLDLE